MKRLLCGTLVMALMPCLQATVTADILITEINSNATGGDFFELYNRGTTPISLNNWSYDDDSLTPGLGGVFGDITLQPGSLLVVVTGDSSDFATGWGLDPADVVFFPAGSGGVGPGLGKSDLIALYDDSSNLVTALNYGAASKGGIPPMTLSDGSSALGDHAGISAGGSNAAWSAVWDGVSSIFAPRYTYAQLGVLGAYQGADASAIGSPGVVPEPASVVLFSLAGLAGLVWYRLRR